MALLEIFALGAPLVYATGHGPVGDRLLYATSAEFGIRNDDGSETFGHGSGLVWNSASQSFTAGTVTELRHFGSDGKFAGRMTELDLPVAAVVTALERGFMQSDILAGNDTLVARTRAGGAVVNDRLEAGAGGDIIYGGSGNDRLIGDTHLNASGDDVLYGGSGDDRFYGAGGNDAFFGGRGTDLAVFPALFRDLAIASDGSGGYTVTTRYGVTTLKSVERIGADDGILERTASGGWRRISSTPGMARAMPWSVKKGYGGNDTLRFDGFAEEAFWNHGIGIGLGGNGDDYLLFWGFNHDGLLKGGDGDDFIEIHTGWHGKVRAYGGSGNDHLAVYYNGSHYLDGGAGDDLIEAGFGDDSLVGGPGSDTFVFPVRVSEELAAAGDEISFGDDLITDFVIGTDRIILPSRVLNRTSLVQTAGGLLLTVTLIDAGDAAIGSATVLLAGVVAPDAVLDDLMNP